MKKHTIIIVLLFFISTNFYAQGGGRRMHDKIMSARVGFISNELSLSSEQAEKFWPIYKTFKQETFSLHQRKREIERDIEFDNISEEKAQQYVNEIQEIERNLGDKKSAFYTNIIKIISYKQFLKLSRVENEFKRNLLERIKRKRD